MPHCHGCGADGNEVQLSECALCGTQVCGDCSAECGDCKKRFCETGIHHENCRWSHTSETGGCGYERYEAD